ncbi:hypothetical protein D3C84_454860 [compost metagenome]
MQDALGEDVVGARYLSGHGRDGAGQGLDIVRTGGAAHRCLQGAQVQRGGDHENLQEGIRGGGKVADLRAFVDHFVAQLAAKPGGRLHGDQAVRVHRQAIERRTHHADAQRAMGGVQLFQVGPRLERGDVGCAEVGR